MGIVARRGSELLDQRGGGRVEIHILDRGWAREHLQALAQRRNIRLLAQAHLDHVQAEAAVHQSWQDADRDVAEQLARELDRAVTSPTAPPAKMTFERNRIFFMPRAGCAAVDMAAIYPPNAVGGNVFLGFISAVAFASTLSVVPGLPLAGAAAVSHALFGMVIKGGRADSAAELKVSRVTPIALGFIAVLGGIAFEKQNIAFMVSLAFAVAASANFPVLLMSVLSKGCITRGAVIGGFLGLVSSVALSVVSPSVWEVTLGKPKGSARFTHQLPALFLMTLAFVGIWLFSLLDKSPRTAKDRAGFLAQQVRSETGIGASGASGHRAPAGLAGLDNNGLLNTRSGGRAGQNCVRTGKRVDRIKDDPFTKPANHADPRRADIKPDE